MNVVRHEAVRPNPHAKAFGQRGESELVPNEIVVVMKHVLAVVATMGDVMGKAGENDSTRS
jgi:hypothetical protein